MKGRTVIMAIAAVAIAVLPACRSRESSGEAERPPAGPPVLSPEVGRQLEGIVRSDAVKSAVPAGWTLESVQVKARSILLKLVGPGGATASLEMRAQDAGGAQKGRWFSYDAPATPPGLAALAAALDAGFPASPWSEPRHEGVAPHPGETPATPPGGQAPPAPPQASPGPPSAPAGESPPAPPVPPGTPDPPPSAAPTPPPVPAPPPPPGPS